MMFKLFTLAVLALASGVPVDTNNKADVDNLKDVVCCGYEMSCSYTPGVQCCCNNNPPYCCNAGYHCFAQGVGCTPAGEVCPLRRLSVAELYDSGHAATADVSRLRARSARAQVDAIGFKKIMEQVA